VPLPFRLAACLSLLAFSVLYAAQDTAPKAPVRDVTDTYFGTKIVDPYRWMESLKSPEMVAWMKAQNEYTRRYLDGLPVGDAFLKRRWRVEQRQRCGVRRAARSWQVLLLQAGTR